MELTIDQALIKGVEAHKTGKLEEADRYYTAILKANPNHPDANHNMGVLAVGIGKVQEALPFFKTALEANSNIAQFWLSYIDALIKLNRVADAKAVLNEAKSKGIKGDGFAQIEKRLGSATFRSSNLQDPPPNRLNSLINLFNQKKLQQVFNESQILTKQYSKSLVLWNLMGISAAQIGKLDEAVLAFQNAIGIKPDFAEAYNNMGNTLKNQGKLEEAIEAYNKALSLKPDIAEAYNNIGIALKEQGKLEEAIEAYTKALSLKPDYAEAYNNLGNALKDQEKLEEAIETFNKALSIKPDYAEAYYNIGNALKDQEKLEEAIIAYNKALSLKPDYTKAFYNLGIALTEQGKLEKAVEAYKGALLIEPYNRSTKHIIASLTGKKTKKAPMEYVENLFDSYAKKFEISLVDKLQYRTPKLIVDILSNSNDHLELGSVLDLGCGTGLLGQEIKDCCSKLEGIDLSNKMLTLAKQKNVYDKLTQADIVDYLSCMTLDFDYYIALDVFVYVGSLSEIFRLIKIRNKKPGRLIFSTEHTEVSGYHLLQTGRYSHSKSYVESLCKKFDYTISHFSTTKLRKHKGLFLKGGIYILNFAGKI